MIVRSILEKIANTLLVGSNTASPAGHKCPQTTPLETKPS